MSIPATHKVILFEKTGGPEVIEVKEQPVPEINDTEILVQTKWSGVNYVESYFRSGAYASELPRQMGSEASGIVVKVGKDVKDLAVGDKVCYNARGAFAQYFKLDTKSSNIYKLPADISEENFKKMGSVIIQGLTAHSLCDLSYKVSEGEYALVWAAAGGVGQVLLQLLKKKGVHTIALASSDEKLQLAKSLGAEYTINYKKEDVAKKVKEITKNVGVDVAYDSIGKETFELTCECLRINGHFISFGNAGGLIPPITITKLPKNINITRPYLFQNYNIPGFFETHMKKLYEELVDGSVVYNISKTFPFEDYAKATTLLENHGTTGKLSLQF